MKGSSMRVFHITTILGLLAHAVASAESQSKAHLDNFLLIEQAVVDYANDATVDELQGLIGARASDVVAARPFANAQSLRRLRLDSAEVDKLGQAARQNWVPELEAPLPPSATIDVEPTEATLLGLSPGIIQQVNDCDLHVVRTLVETDTDIEQDIATLTYTDGAVKLSLSQRDGRPVLTRRDANGVELGSEALESTTLVDGELDGDLLLLNFPTMRLAVLGTHGLAVVADHFLDAERQKVLLSLEFTGLGIFNFHTSKNENNEDTINNVEVEMYCDNLVAKFA
jgi:hypothetical protein